MFRCPTCRSGLTRLAGVHGYFWRCDRCRGRAATMTVLRNAIDAHQVNEMWHGARESEGNRAGCPACGHPMHMSVVRTETEPVRLDVCRSCHLVWFDSWKFELFRPSVRPSAEPPAAPSHRPARLLR